jgi:ABC-2 type transport system permease protein
MSQLSKYIKSFSMGINEAMQYRLNFVFSLLSAVFPITIQIFLWNAVYMQDREKKVYGFTYSQMIVYTLLAGIVARFVSGGFEWSINDDIKNGGLNKYITKPIGYFEFRASCFLGKKVTDSFMMILLLVGTLAFSSLYLGLGFSVNRVLVFAASLVIATILNFIMVYCLSAAAFWISDAGSVFIIVNIIINVLSGGVFPVEIFGSRLNEIFNYLPFKYSLYYPIVIISGRVGEGDMLQIVFIQLLWVVVLGLIAKFIWKLGMKSYIGVGG